jgi:hypothetical protein
MKRLVAALAFAGLISGTALASQMGGGIAGYVTSVNTGKAIDHATILYYRAPYVDNATIVKKLTTDRKGFFSDITLEPGRYIIMAKLPGKVMGCAVDDVMNGEISHVDVKMGRNQIMCSGPRVHPTLVDPNATASVYRI